MNLKRNAKRISSCRRIKKWQREKQNFRKQVNGKDKYVSKKMQNHNSKVSWNLNGCRTKMHDNNNTNGRKELKCSKFLILARKGKR